MIQLQIHYNWYWYQKWTSIMSYLWSCCISFLLYTPSFITSCHLFTYLMFNLTVYSSVQHTYHHCENKLHFDDNKEMVLNSHLFCKHMSNLLNQIWMFSIHNFVSKSDINHFYPYMWFKHFCTNLFQAHCIWSNKLKHN